MMSLPSGLCYFLTGLLRFCGDVRLPVVRRLWSCFRRTLSLCFPAVLVEYWLATAGLKLTATDFDTGMVLQMSRFFHRTPYSASRLISSTGTQAWYSKSPPDGSRTDRLGSPIAINIELDS